MARSHTRISVLFVLAVLLVAPWSTAAPREDHESSPQLLVQLWHQLADLWSDIGCIIDPSGGCRESSSVPISESCIMDPDGRCRESSAPAGDIGCVADPHGGCGH